MNYIPDFSGDDFISDKEIQKVRREMAAREKLIADSLLAIQQNLNLRKSSHKNLKAFSNFNNLQATVLKSFRPVNSPLNLVVALVEYRSSFPLAKGTNAGTDKYFFGYLGLRKKFPKTLICKETIKEKVTDLFLKSETDFPEHKYFSKKFFVLTQDCESLSERLKFKNLDELTVFPDMEVEIHENSCLFRNSRRSITPNEAIQF